MILFNTEGEKKERRTVLLGDPSRYFLVIILMIRYICRRILFFYSLLFYLTLSTILFPRIFTISEQVSRYEIFSHVNFKLSQTQLFVNRNDNRYPLKYILTIILELETKRIQICRDQTQVLQSLTDEKLIKIKLNFGNVTLHKNNIEVPSSF